MDQTIATRHQSDGDYVSETKIGRSKADVLLQQIRVQQNPTLFGAAIRKIAERGEYGAAEIGFCHRMAEHLVA